MEVCGASFENRVLRSVRGDEAGSFLPVDYVLGRLPFAGGVGCEGRDGVGYRFAQGAGLYTAGPPQDATGEHATVVDPTDATAVLVLSPYLATSTSIAHAAAYPPVIATEAGEPIVFHLTREITPLPSGI